MATDMFLKIDGMEKHLIKRRPDAMMAFLVSFHGASGLSSVQVGPGHRRHPRLSQRGELAMKRVLVFALEAAVGAVACAGTILAIFAWTGASL
jgi:hypothetical protein